MPNARAQTKTLSLSPPTNNGFNATCFECFFVTICYFGGFFVFCGFYPETGEGVVFTSHNSHFYCDFVIDLYLIILG